MLKVDNIETFYGQSQALFGMTLSAGKGEVVTLMGRNGAGKTTTVRSSIGFTPPRSGAITFDGQRTERWPAYRVAQAGIGVVPEGRQICPNLSVHENLLATSANRRASTPGFPVATSEARLSIQAARHNRISSASGSRQSVLR